MKIQPLRTDGCFEEVMEKYSDMIYRIAYANVRVKADAEDVFQEVWCRYYQKNKTFESEEHRRNWLINVTLKCCKKIYSSVRYKRTILTDDMSLLKERLPERDFELYDAVIRLPEKYRIPIYLYYYEGFSVNEISDITKTNPSTVRSQMKRGREKLKEILKGDEFSE
ncbi:MAG: sigma-70 family RNA polymerase sigma factor [Clostridia bacterium]|nr:sigma-70 family RNA polymerase sigma factor [Clostridia bacterium]MBQ7117584.1 sigma-70 family RNA polymerase sigma factor [Clostridia bacterium]